MDNKTKRLNEAFNYLKLNGLVSSQKDLAARIGTSAPNVSSALSGSQIYLTDKFLLKFNNSVNNIFNIDWLLHGDGSMLMDSNPPPLQPIHKEKIKHATLDDDLVGQIKEMNKIVSQALTSLEKALDNNDKQNSRFIELLNKAIEKG